MKTFKYALFVGFSLACIPLKGFAQTPSLQDIATLEQKAD